jgi:cytochrome c oxidase cbb3-type subunit 4
MDINTIRMIVEVFCFVTFLAIVAWAWSGRNRSRFDEAARLPFDAEEEQDRG